MCYHRMYYVQRNHSTIIIWCQQFVQGINRPIELNEIPIRQALHVIILIVPGTECNEFAGVNIIYIR